jgi:hypothetical protein
VHPDCTADDIVYTLEITPSCGAIDTSWIYFEDLQVKWYTPDDLVDCTFRVKVRGTVELTALGITRSSGNTFYLYCKSLCGSSISVTALSSQQQFSYTVGDGLL